MRQPFGISVPALILIGTFSAACDARVAFEGHSAGPSPLQTAAAAELRAQPESVRPVFGRDDSCRVSPPFHTTITVIVNAGRDITVGGLGFQFTDKFGKRTAPTVRPGSSTAASIPTTLPVPLPSAQPIPIPRPGALAGLAVDAGGRLTLPFTLHFACGIPGSGTLVIVVATVDHFGVTGSSQVVVRIG
jgi:hypothetical protein